MYRGIEHRPWRPPVGEPQLAAALDRDALVCLAVETIGDGRLTAVVLPWPYVLDGCLVFHHRGPTRRIELPAAALPAASAGDLYAAELSSAAPDAPSLAWPPVDVTDQARAFTG